MRDEKGRDIYFYTHDHGSKLEAVVAAALVRGHSRREDYEYLARIVFSELIRYEVLGELGYGIGHVEHIDLQNPLVVVDVGKQVVELYQTRTGTTRGALISSRTFPAHVAWVQPPAATRDVEAGR
jgi:hypothetical protein